MQVIKRSNLGWLSSACESYNTPLPLVLIFCDMTFSFLHAPAILQILTLDKA